MDELIPFLLFLMMLAIITIPVGIWFGGKWAITVFCILLFFNIWNVIRSKD